MPKRVVRSGPGDKPGKPAPSRRKRRNAARSGAFRRSIPVEPFLQEYVRDLYAVATERRWKAVLRDLMERGYALTKFGELGFYLLVFVLAKQGYRVSIVPKGRDR